MSPRWTIWHRGLPICLAGRRCGGAGFLADVGRVGIHRKHLDASSLVESVSLRIHRRNRAHANFSKDDVEALNEPRPLAEERFGWIRPPRPGSVAVHFLRTL